MRTANSSSASAMKATLETDGNAKVSKREMSQFLAHLESPPKCRWNDDVTFQACNSDLPVYYIENLVTSAGTLTETFV